LKHTQVEMSPASFFFVKFIYKMNNYGNGGSFATLRIRHG
jgi:hypothetical protein